jgi:glucose/arabinose dehydrogenase
MAASPATRLAVEILELNRGKASSIPMDPVRLVFFGGAHFLFAASSASVAVVCRRKGMRLIACTALAAVVALTILASIADPASSLLVGVMREIRASHRGSILCVALGVSTAAPWLLLALAGGGTSLSWKSRVVVPLLTTSLFASAACVALLFYRAFKSSVPEGRYSVELVCLDPRFAVEEVASFANADRVEELGAHPICAAVDEQDNVFVSVQMDAQGYYSGQIVQVLDDVVAGNRSRLRTVAESPCLFRVFGLAVREGQIYVSRSGFLPRARKGVIAYENSGAITRLSDLDRDGVMDYYEDLVEGLPGCQGPGPAHSNNAIAFGRDGSLYFTQGVPTDRDVLNHPWEGKILRASVDFKKISVFASGLRNPFGLVHGPDGQLFATDNDVTAGNPGDELNLIEEGADYGHPYVVGDEDGGGMFVKPLLLWDKGSFGGIAYSESPSLPEEYRGCLFIADFLGSQILRVTVTRHGGVYSARETSFVKVPAPIGIAVTRSGVFYITSFEGAVFRVRRNAKVK